MHAFAEQIASVSIDELAVVAFLLVAGALLASLRLKIIARDLHYPLTFMDSIATLSVSQLAGAFFFQIAGQLIARSAMLTRREIPTAATIAMVGYERLAALTIALILAACGAIYLFGHVTLDFAGGGLTFIRLSFGISVAVLGGAAIGWYPIAKPLLLRINRTTLFRFSRSLLLSLLIQITTMLSYVVLANQFSPQTPIESVLAASTIVMLAASIPISLAGWGVREASSVAALGFIGLSPASALAVAVLIGTLSLAVVGLLATISAAFWKTASYSTTTAPSHAHINYTEALQITLPLIVAILVCFQIYVPLQSGNIQANLADPFAVLGGIFFVIQAIKRKALPQWREPFVFQIVVFATLIMGVSLLIGLARIGPTGWALTNKFGGWFVLLAYGATCALIVNAAGNIGLRMLLLTFAGAMAAIAGVELALFCIHYFTFALPPEVFPIPVSGFSQNRNAFALQCLMALAATFSAAPNRTTKSILTTILISAIFISGSRAGILAMVILIVTAAYLRKAEFGNAKLYLVLGSLASTVTAITFVTRSGFFRAQGIYLAFEGSDSQHLESAIAAIGLFLDHPIFGAGLGTFYSSSLRTEGPLVIHSTPLWLLAEFGLVGSVAFIIPVAVLYWRSARERPQTVATAAISLSIVAFSAMSLFHELLYQRPLWVILGAALASAMPALQAQPGPYQVTSKLNSYGWKSHPRVTDGH